jgi:GntR family transcriptional regulator
LPGRGRIVRLHGECVPPVPQYRRIADELRASIEAGALKQGDVLPSEAALRARYGVARETVRRALAELEGAGLIASSQGKGWFVLTP